MEKKKELKLLKNLMNNEDTKQYFPKDNYNVGSYIESKIEENIFDEEINPSERKEYDNVSNVTFVIEDIDGKKI